jgi:hypothetical protein
VDTKKRELVGDFKNPGARWDLSPRWVNDHDFRSDSSGVAIPYGIYDLLANRGSVVVGVSHDTPTFAAHAIAHWWRQEGLLRYPRSRQLLILSDTGGSNGYRCHAWKTQLQSQLADSHGLTLTVAHYPTGASKWNPIEHRLFSAISKNWAGEPLDSYHKILHFIRSKLKPACRSTLTSTVATIQPAQNPHPNNFRLFASGLTKPCPSGTTLSHPICEIVFAPTLS